MARIAAAPPLRAPQQKGASMTSTGEPAAATPANGRGGRAGRVLGGLALLIALGAGYAGWDWFSHGRFHESTDDAYLQADLITLQARDSGYVAEVLVAPNAPVRRGQVIALIDPADYRLALDAAANSLALAESAETQLAAQITAGAAAIKQAQAQLMAARATSDGAQKSFRRAQDLRSSSAGTQAALDAAEATAKSAAAQVASAEAGLMQAEAALAVLKARRDSARLDVRQARTREAQARRDLDFTRIRAPFDGILTERQIEVGSFVTTGSRIGTLVPVADIHVGANFKETQIAGIRPGASAVIRVDAWPDEELRGTVDSLTAGTGQVFSLLPSSNATGNFTKVVQRVPVRIALDPAQLAEHPLRVGLSMEVTVDTQDRSGPALAEAPRTQPVAQTAVYEALDQGAEADVARIIQANL